MRSPAISNSQCGPKRRLFIRIGQGLATAFVLLTFVLLGVTLPVRAEVPPGSLEEAKAYFAKLSKNLKYSTPEKISETTLTDLAAYLGYKTLTAEKLEFDPPETLMADYGATPGDVLVSRFFEPKIMNVKFKEGDDAFRLGWRKLVRLKAQPDSDAKKEKEPGGKIGKIASAVILFNIFTDPRNPKQTPFARDLFSENTQVMLLPDPEDIRPLVGKKGDGQMDSLYWLDYLNATRINGEYVPGKLGYKLHTSFEANELPGEGTKDYFVPHACVACHGNNMQRAFPNFMDTDHWFDRLKEFPKFKASEQAVLFDAGTNDTTSPKYRTAFDRIRIFNLETEKHALLAQPKHDEPLSSAKWAEIHENNYDHVPPIKRTVGGGPQEQWQPSEAKILETMNQYCYRCHGTVKFTVFDKKTTMERKANIMQRIAANAAVGLKMPPDRELPADDRQMLLDYFKDANP